MPLFGAHLSTKGGLHNAVSAAAALGCGTVQFFTKNANTWEAPPLAEAEIAMFRTALANSGLRFATAHDSYLINVASPDDALFAKSVNALASEMERAEALGLSYLVMHPGAHTGSGEEAGLARVVAGLEEVHHRCPGFSVRLLVETTAGQGTTLGYRFEHLAAILQRANCSDRLGVCFDTCHVFAAGYPLAAEGEDAATFQQFDDLVGLARLRLFHVNDSAKPLGSRVDRHAGIGQGEIGLAAFRRLVNDPRFADHPMIIETPKEDDDGNDLDPANLAVLRGILDGGLERESSRGV
jgi:deoxyribonuclease-4